MAKSIKHKNNTMVKKYIAIISQSETNDPVYTVLNSGDVDFLGNIVWTRVGDGTYWGTLTGVFTIGKTWVAKPNNGFEAEEFSGSVSLVRDGNSEDRFLLRTDLEAGTHVDNALFNCSIEIRVYP